MDIFFNYTKVLYLGNARVESASLDMRANDAADGLVLDSELFRSEYLNIPNYKPMLDDGPTIDLFLEESVVRCYSCWTQILQSSESDSAVTDLPSLDEFSQLVDIAIGDDAASICSSLDWLLSSDVHFGVAPDLTQPGFAAVRRMRSAGDRIAAHVASSNLGGRVEILARLLSQQISIALATADVSGNLFEELNQRSVTVEEEQILAVGSHWSLLPWVRGMAAEYLSYTNNRIAQKASSVAQAFERSVEASRMAHYSVLCTAMPRNCKYLAQNLLEASLMSDDNQLRRAAEIVWIDAFMMPYIEGLTVRHKQLQSDLGWKDERRPSLEAVRRFQAIPAYGVAPDFVIDGGLQKLGGECPPGFSLDVWSAAVLLVQHYKNLESPITSREVDISTPIFVESENPSDRWPMRSTNPVGWLFALADHLFEMHQSRLRPHAGLVGAIPLNIAYRDWLNKLVATAFNKTELDRGSQRTLPQVVRFIDSGRRVNAKLNDQDPEWRLIESSWR